MAIFFAPFARIFLHRRMLYSTVLSEVHKKYAGSILGSFWLIVYPLIFLAAYSMIYGLVFKVKYADFTTGEYLSVIFSGLIVFLGFNESITTGCTSVVSNVGLIKNTLFPIEMIPVRTVICAQVTQLVGTVMLLIAMTVHGKITLHTPLFIFVWSMQILMELGLVWFLSSLNVIIKDIQTIIGIFMLIIMMASPIAYPISYIPLSLLPYMPLNPVYCFIVANQHVFVFGSLPDNNIILGIVFWSFLPFILGYNFFQKMKKVFIDNV